MDKFAFDDLIFNVGVRVDRYDANQQVLKDDFSLYPTRTIKRLVILMVKQLLIQQIFQSLLQYI